MPYLNPLGTTMLSNFLSRKAETEAKTKADPKLPTGLLECDAHAIHASPDLVELAMDGWNLKLRIEALQAELKAINNKLEEAIGAGAKLRVEGVCTVNVSGRQTITLTDVGMARQVLGGRFMDLVDERTEYTLTDKLKELVLDADHPLSESLRGCIQVKDSTSVTFRAAAKAV